MTPCLFFNSLPHHRVCYSRVYVPAKLPPRPLWPASTRSSCMHREAALSRPSHCIKAGASEWSPPLWPGINATRTLWGNAECFTREVCAGKGGGLGRPGRSDAGVVVVLILNHFRCSTGSLQNYSIIALSFLRNHGKKCYLQCMHV